MIAESDEGDEFPFRIIKIEDDIATIDMNHELAGKDLTFEIEVVAVRMASEEEKEHGYAHVSNEQQDHS